MSTATPQNLDERLDAIVAEVRRQGRAGIAAQAAAEACLDEVKALRAELAERDDGEPLAANRGDANQVEPLILALLPVADAIERVIAEAERLASAPEPSRFARWFGARSTGADAASLREAARVLRSSLDQALETSGVRADRRVGIPIDGDVHRVVEACDASPGSPPDTVLRVVRAGYARGGTMLREADVVAMRRNQG